MSDGHNSSRGHGQVSLQLEAVKATAKRFAEMEQLSADDREALAVVFDCLLEYVQADALKAGAAGSPFFIEVLDDRRDDTYGVKVIGTISAHDAGHMLVDVQHALVALIASNTGAPKSAVAIQLGLGMMCRAKGQPVELDSEAVRH